MRKKIIRFVLMLVMLAAIPMSVSAEDFKGKDGWKVSFYGDKMDSTFKSSDIDEAVYKLQPGDSIEITLTLENTYHADTDWYMANEVLQSLEDNDNSANGGAYSYILNYVNPRGESTLLYSSESIGGEGDSKGGKGLHQATSSLEEFFYLDLISGGKSAKIVLKVSLEGETHGNDYQNTLAKLQMKFAAEKAAGAPPATGTPSKKAKTVKTGDDSSIMLYISLAALALGLMILLLVLKRMRDKKDEQASEAHGGYGNGKGAE